MEGVCFCVTEDHQPACLIQRKSSPVLITNLNKVQNWLC